MSQSSFELYAGDWKTICDVCESGKLEALRAGAYSESHLLFPAEFVAGDILFVQDAVADLTSNPLVHIDFERAESDGGLFIDRLVVPWVHSIASLSDNSGQQLMKRWAALYYSAENSKPAWNIHTSNTLGADLIRICRFSIDNKLDLSMVWIL